ncbi:MAG: CHAT domain-containing protein [Cyanobacteria bacterium P01_G01_bin.54]
MPSSRSRHRWRQGLLLTLMFLMVLLLVSSGPLIAQTGNQSDVTGPNPVETVPGSGNDPVERIDRAAYETFFTSTDAATAIALVEEFHAWEFCNQLQLERCGRVPSLAEMTQTLADTWAQTGRRPALVYFVALEDQLQSLVLMPSRPTISAQAPKQTTPPLSPIVLRHSNPDLPRELILSQGRQFRRQLNLPGSQRYRTPAEQLYNELMAPLATELAQAKVDVLVIVPDQGMRLLPFSALHDGNRFLIEQYAVSLMPSFGLSDLQVADVRNTPILAMGAAQFADQPSLPAVPTELAQVVRAPWQGEVLFEQAFTVANLRDRLASGQFGVVHLATHGIFRGGDLANSYIQFSDRRLTLLAWRDLVSQLNWQSASQAQLELWVLSACETAVGSTAAELGFAGLAVQLSAKSALASFWQVSDAGTLALMSEFYRQLSTVPFKAEALQRAQLALLRGAAQIQNNQLQLSDGQSVPVADTVSQQANLRFSHPYYWSGFTNIGSWN